MLLFLRNQGSRHVRGVCQNASVRGSPKCLKNGEMSRPNRVSRNDMVLPLSYSPISNRLRSAVSLWFHTPAVHRDCFKLKLWEPGEATPILPGCVRKSGVKSMHGRPGDSLFGKVRSG